MKSLNIAILTMAIFMPNISLGAPCIPAADEENFDEMWSDPEDVAEVLAPAAEEEAATGEGVVSAMKENFLSTSLDAEVVGEMRIFRMVDRVVEGVETPLEVISAGIAVGLTIYGIVDISNRWGNSTDLQRATAILGQVPVVGGILAVFADIENLDRVRKQKEEHRKRINIEVFRLNSERHFTLHDPQDIQELETLKYKADHAFNAYHFTEELEGKISELSDSHKKELEQVSLATKKHVADHHAEQFLDKSTPTRKFLCQVHYWLHPDAPTTPQGCIEFEATAEYPVGDSSDHVFSDGVTEGIITDDTRADSVTLPGDYASRGANKEGLYFTLRMKANGSIILNADNLAGSTDKNIPNGTAPDNSITRGGDGSNPDNGLITLKRGSVKIFQATKQGWQEVSFSSFLDYVIDDYRGIFVAAAKTQGTPEYSILQQLIKEVNLLMSKYSPQNYQYILTI